MNRFDSLATGELRDLYKQDPREAFSDCDKWLCENPPPLRAVLVLDSESCMKMSAIGVNPIEFAEIVLQHGHFEITGHLSVQFDAKLNLGDFKMWEGGE